MGRCDSQPLQRQSARLACASHPSSQTRVKRQWQRSVSALLWLLPGGGRAQGVHSGRGGLRAAAAAPGGAAGRGVQLAARPPRPPGGGRRVPRRRRPSRCRLPWHPAAQVPLSALWFTTAMMCSPLAAALGLAALPQARSSFWIDAEMRGLPAFACRCHVGHTCILNVLLQRLRPGAWTDSQPAAAPAGRGRLPDRADRRRAAAPAHWVRSPPAAPGGRRYSRPLMHVARVRGDMLRPVLGQVPSH